MPVKPKYIKDIGIGLMETYPKSISTDFEQNKTLVTEATNIESKTVRNRVAGFLCRKRASQLHKNQE